MVNQRNTKPVSFSITPAADNRLAMLAQLQATTKSAIVNDLALTAPDAVPHVILNVVSLDPLVITGDRWEGQYTGIIGVRFPMNADDPTFYPVMSYFRISDTFEGVISRLQ